MASGKLSPRQKMINMMYLVLIALLALNVSKEILKAFHLMELSFDQASKNIDGKNEAIMGSFKASFEKFPDKTKPWMDKANAVRAAAKELTDYINKVEDDIVGKEGRKPLETGQAPGTKNELMMPDNMEKHANYFAEGSGKQGQGKVLQAKINDTREKMLSVLDDPQVKKIFPTLKAELEKATALRAEDPEHKTEGGHTSWVSMYLEHAPLAGVTALLSKTQADCKNLEADILKALVDQIGATDTKVNKFDVFVNAPSSYVMSGGTYEADIVLAAYNSNEQPKIMVNGVALPVEGGIGKYKVPASGSGEHDFKAQITVETPEGPKTFEKPAKWTSFTGTAAISADKMNVLYVGLDNPITVSAPGVAPQNLIVSMTGSGTLSGSAGKYSARVTATGNREANVNVSARMSDGTVKGMGSMKYRVRTVPKPEAKWGGSLSSGEASKNSLAVMPGMKAILENFVFEGVTYAVTEYQVVLASKKAGLVGPVRVTGWQSGGALSVINQARPGDILLFTSIKATGPGGSVTLSPLTFTIK